ncbi:hypothetical protein vseg_016361 [Gypsophila vaccaria]
MTLTQSYITNFPPILSPITKFKTLTRSISISPQFSPNSIDRHCCCTSNDEINPSTSKYDVVLGTETDQIDGVVINISEIGKRCRRIESRVIINAGLQIVWGILTDYEKLADFIPGLAVSRLIDKRDNYARLFQIGQQNLPLGFKFNAKAVLDCYEKELEVLSYGLRRDIDFTMVEGDFDIFEGKWSIEQYDAEKCNDIRVANLLEGKEHQTILSYVVEVKPKPWLPVGLIESRLCRDIKTNLCCVREEAHLRLSSSYS